MTNVLDYQLNLLQIRNEMQWFADTLVCSIFSGKPSHFSLENVNSLLWYHGIYSVDSVNVQKHFDFKLSSKIRDFSFVVYFFLMYSRGKVREIDRME